MRLLTLFSFLGGETSMNYDSVGFSRASPNLLQCYASGAHYRWCHHTMLLQTLKHTSQMKQNVPLYLCFSSCHLAVVVTGPFSPKKPQKGQRYVLWGCRGGADLYPPVVRGVPCPSFFLLFNLGIPCKSEVTCTLGRTGQ
jgi:hypothetical protein